MNVIKPMLNPAPSESLKSVSGQIPVLVLSETSSTNIEKPWDRKNMFSPLMLRRIASNTEDIYNYFHRLSYAKRIKLLRQTKMRTDVLVSSEFANSLTNSLKLPLVELTNWLRYRFEKNRKIAQNQDLTDVQIALLEEEFKLSGCIIEERALLLSYELDLSTDAIRSWFKSKKLATNKLKKTGLQSGNSSLGNAAIAERSASALKKCSSPVDKFIYSSSLCARIDSLKKNSFFYNLSPSDQLLLLERFHEFPINDRNSWSNIASELTIALFSSTKRNASQKIPDIADMVIWLQETRNLYRKLAKCNHTTNAVHEEVTNFLEDEFNASNLLTDGRAVILSYVLALPVNDVRHWFYQRNIKLQEQAVVAVSPATLSSTRVATSCSEDQYIQLIETFKTDGSSFSTNIEEVAEQTNLPQSQVRYWFSNTHHSLRSFTTSQVLENLSAGLSELTIMELEERYWRSRRISFQQAAASASILKLENAKLVLSWFEWRRTYELLRAHHPGQDIQEECERIFNIVEGYIPRPAGVLTHSSNYGICYDDTNCAMFALQRCTTSNTSYVAASAGRNPEMIIPKSDGNLAVFEPNVDFVSDSSSSAPPSKQE